MSDTATDGTRTLHTVPAPEPLTPLTGAPAAIYTALAGSTDPDGVTAAELALAAGVGRSTAGKALTTLEEHGLAVRTPGGHDGPRRIPDLWRAALRRGTSSSDGFSDQEPAGTQPTPSVTDSPEPVSGSAGHEEDASNETTAHSPAAPHDAGIESDTVPAAEALQDAPSQVAEVGEADNSGDAGPRDEHGSDSAKDASAPAAQASSGEQAAPAETITSLGEKKRLAPGTLRQMVIDHLQAHPETAFTSTALSRVIGKSSGAIANALVTLAKRGQAQQVSDHPRRYQLRADADQ